MLVSQPKKIIELTKKEAEIFYNSNVDNDCTYKYIFSGKKIWWGVLDKNNYLSYGLCQNCYHSGKFDDIKNTLIPYITENLGFCCNGKTLDESFNLHIKDYNWRAAVYTLEPNINIIPSFHEKKDDKIYINSYTNLEKTTFAILFLLNFKDSNISVISNMYDENNKMLKYNTTITKIKRDHYVLVIKGFIGYNNGLFSFKKENEENSLENKFNTIRLKFLNLSMNSQENLIITKYLPYEFIFKVNHISDIKSPQNEICI